MWFRDTHPTDQDLILAADGELPTRRVERLRKHLGGCWECRVRAQELEGAISEFVHLHRRNLDPLLPPAAGSRALLKARLDDHDLASQPSSLLNTFIIEYFHCRSLGTDQTMGRASCYTCRSGHIARS